MWVFVMYIIITVFLVELLLYINEVRVRIQSF